jgi:TRAP-type C4-dicarboxylate transport system permease small subunit
VRLTDLLSIWRARLARISELVAAFGGLVLSAAMLFTVVAVSMAAAGWPILGDTEIVEFAAGIAIACFMPYCQMQGGHVVITTFTDGLPRPVIGILDFLGSIIVALVIAVLAWRLIAGGFDAYDKSRISMFLHLPRWWGFAIATFPCLLWIATVVFGLAERAAGLAPGDDEGRAA